MWSDVNSVINAYVNSQIMVWESLPALVMSVAFVAVGLSVANLTGWPVGYERVPDLRKGHAQFEVELGRSVAFLLIGGIISYGISWLLSTFGYGCCSSVTGSFIRIMENAILFPIYFFGMIGLAIGVVFGFTRIFR